MKVAPARDYQNAAEMVARYTMIRNHFFAIPARVEATPPVPAAQPAIGAARNDVRQTIGATESARPEPAPKLPRGVGLDANDILRAVCREFDITIVELLSDRRSADVVRPRHIAFVLCKHLTTCSLSEIGRRFGGRDHSTVLHGVRKLARFLAATKDGMPHDATPAQWVRAMREHMGI
jgi:hypothetical protein